METPGRLSIDTPEKACDPDPDLSETAEKNPLECDKHLRSSDCEAEAGGNLDPLLGCLADAEPTTSWRTVLAQYVVVEASNRFL